MVKGLVRHQSEVSSGHVSLTDDPSGSIRLVVGNALAFRGAARGIRVEVEGGCAALSTGSESFCSWSGDIDGDRIKDGSGLELVELHPFLLRLGVSSSGRLDSLGRRGGFGNDRTAPDPLAEASVTRRLVFGWNGRGRSLAPVIRLFDGPDALEMSGPLGYRSPATMAKIATLIDLVGILKRLSAKLRLRCVPSAFLRPIHLTPGTSNLRPLISLMSSSLSRDRIIFSLSVLAQTGGVPRVGDGLTQV